MLAQIFEKIYGGRLKGLEGVPGPTPSFPFGNAGDFLGQQQPWEVCADYARTYGGLTRVWLLGRPALVLNDPELIQTVLESDWTQFYKKAPCAELEPVITRESLFITNPPEWNPARERNPLTKVDPNGWFESLLPPLQSAVSAELERFVQQSTQAEVDLYREMQRLAFHVFARAFWGKTLAPEVFDWFQAMARTGDFRMKSQTGWLPALNPVFVSRKSRWYAEFTERVHHARDAGASGDVDLLALQKDSPLSDDELAEALATNFFGGVFSGSSTINTALFLLSQHPEEQETLRTAVMDELGGESLQIASLLSCQQLDCVLRESMRYYPAVPIYFRNSNPKTSVTLGAHSLPPDTQLFITNWYLHKYAEHWGDPETFRPDRWKQGAAEQNPIGSGYFFPFGRGPRMCVGADYAMFFMKLVLATIVRETSVDMDPHQDYRQSFFFGVMMPKGLKAKFSRTSYSA